jgi:hypothetical protein
MESRHANRFAFTDAGNLQQRQLLPETGHWHQNLGCNTTLNSNLLRMMLSLQVRLFWYSWGRRSGPVSPLEAQWAANKEGKDITYVYTLY